MTSTRFYPIGTPGKAWGEAELEQWRASQSRQRSYADDIVARIKDLSGRFETFAYGQLDYAGEHFNLYALRNGSPDAALPTALITGGVHGYETSGVMGVLQFLETRAADYAGKANLLVAPCISPWAYERINRWNYNAIDPNRSFHKDSPATECTALMKMVAAQPGSFLMHIDLHETTDSDESEFRPALAARDGEEFVPGSVPDGFYLVDDSDNPQPDFQQAIIAGVEHVTHIAPADEHGKIIGSPVVSHGVIRYPQDKYAMCSSVTGARFTTTTEVYPDSERATSQICNDAQVAAICSALDFPLAQT